MAHFIAEHVDDGGHLAAIGNSPLVDLTSLGGPTATGTQTMTKVTDYGGFLQIATSVFAESGIESWALVGKDPAGNVIHETSGTNTRREG